MGGRGRFHVRLATRTIGVSGGLKSVGTLVGSLAGAGRAAKCPASHRPIPPIRSHRAPDGHEVRRALPDERQGRLPPVEAWPPPWTIHISASGSRSRPACRSSVTSRPPDSWGQELPSDADLQAQLGGAASNTSEVTHARRRRRCLIGVVTIIRPMSQEPNVVRDEPSTAGSKPDSIERVASAKSRRWQVRCRFGSANSTRKAESEDCATGASCGESKEHRGSSAIRWIKRAIKDYGLEARELGFSRELS